MGPIRRLVIERRLRASSEEALMTAALEAGMAEREIEDVVREGGFLGLIEALLKILNDPRLLEIVNTLKTLFLLFARK